jgi:DNA-binding IclR family transcriptional regulator
MASLTNAELAVCTNLPRPTVSRLTRSLVDAGFLRYDVSERAYRLAPVVLSLADAYLQANEMSHIALPLMRKVAATDKVNVGLAVRDQTEMVYLASIQRGRIRVSRTPRVESGSRVPIETTSIGLSYLASLPEKECGIMLEEIAARRGDAWKKLCGRVFRGIAQAKLRGYCTTTYRTDLVMSIGAAFMGRDQQLYGLNISFPYTAGQCARYKIRYADKLLQLVEDIQAAATETSG